MYLTRFEINPQRRDARHYLSSPQRLHAGVLAAFPEHRESATGGRVLWRVDEGRHDAVLYIVSPDKPDLTHPGVPQLTCDLVHDRGCWCRSAGFDLVQHTEMPSNTTLADLLG